MTPRDAATTRLREMLAVDGDGELPTQLMEDIRTVLNRPNAALDLLRDLLDDYDAWYRDDHAGLGDLGEQTLDWVARAKRVLNDAEREAQLAREAGDDRWKPVCWDRWVRLWVHASGLRHRVAGGD